MEVCTVDFIYAQQQIPTLSLSSDNCQNVVQFTVRSINYADAPQGKFHSLPLNQARLRKKNIYISLWLDILGVCTL